jgi:hypothetical protein
MANILLPLPDRDFDVTEVAVPWQLLSDASHQPVFATQAAATPARDPLTIARPTESNPTWAASPSLR